MSLKIANNNLKTKCWFIMTKNYVKKYTSNDISTFLDKE